MGPGGRLDTDEQLRRARELVRTGDLAAAESAYEAVITALPDHAPALHMLGLIAQRRGRLQRAIEMLRKAARAEQGSAEIRTHLGEALRAAGDATGAVEAGREAERLAPNAPPVLNNLGLALQADGQPEQAETVYRRLVTIAPDYPRGHYNLGNLLGQTERPEEAEQRLRRALELKPRYHQAWNALGAVLAALHRPDEAERAYRQALSLMPGYAKANYNLGNLLSDEQRYDEALTCLDAALAADPNYLEAMLAKGSLLTRRDGHYDQGMAILRDAAGRHPNHHRTHLSLAEAHFARFDFAAAASEYHRALEIAPDQPEAKANLILCRAEVCDWMRREQDIADLRELVKRQLDNGKPSPLSPHSTVFFPLSGAKQLSIARRRAENVAKGVEAAARRLGKPDAGSGEVGRLRIGYLSSDFRENALAHLTAGLFGLHDRDRFEIFGYSLGPDDGSVYRQRIANDCDHFADLRQVTDIEVARRIRADGIHILVDLVGNAGGARPGIPAMRPAPVQVIWLYPGTMGGVFHDFMIGDAIATPADRAPEIGERLALMPDTFQITDHAQAVPERHGNRIDFQLPEDGFVFCSFNAHAKIDPETFDVWMELLDAVPGSVLWLLALSRAGRQNLRHEAKARGMDPDRLVFGSHVDRPRHLQRLTLADLALDTLLCNGHTTTSDALWAGLPVITCPGKTFQSRVSASLLHACGMAGLVTSSLADYRRLALELAGDKTKLEEIRNLLHAARDSAPLFDTRRFVHNLESAYRDMWRQRETVAREPIVIGRETNPTEAS